MQRDNPSLWHTFDSSSIGAASTCISSVLDICEHQPGPTPTQQKQTAIVSELKTQLDKPVDDISNAHETVGMLDNTRTLQGT
jgi:hypothetical protein